MMTPRELARNRARGAAIRAFHAGEIEWRPCSQCGGDATVMHHPDYRNPLLVIWLCRPCHSRLHAAGARERCREAPTARERAVAKKMRNCLRCGKPFLTTMAKRVCGKCYRPEAEGRGFGITAESRVRSVAPGKSATVLNGLFGHQRLHSEPAFEESGNGTALPGRRAHHSQEA